MSRGMMKNGERDGWIDMAGNVWNNSIEQMGWESFWSALLLHNWDAE